MNVTYQLDDGRVLKVSEAHQVRVGGYLDNPGRDRTGMPIYLLDGRPISGREAELHVRDGRGRVVFAWWFVLHGKPCRVTGCLIDAPHRHLLDDKLTVTAIAERLAEHGSYRIGPDDHIEPAPEPGTKVVEW